MAIISIFRQYASTGNDIAERLAHKLGYRLITGTDVESKIVHYGFPEEKLKLFNEKRPLFWNSITKERELYISYLKQAILNLASDNNCIFIGKGSFRLLEGVDNHVSFNISATMDQRVERVAKENNINKHSAGVTVLKRDSKQRGFYKDYFGCDIRDTTLFDLTLTAPENKTEIIADMLASIVTRYSSAEQEQAGIDKVNTLAAMQSLANMLVIDYELPITNLTIRMKDDSLVLNGIAESSALGERAKTLVKAEFPNFNVKSEIRAVQDLHSKRGF
ncbi:MAG: cytidylate kinase-like family protein [Treponema sp.]|nr:cytidylate kinase-like family protein [Candidatus Treponema equi]